MRVTKNFVVELREAEEALRQINAYYQDIEAVLRGYEGASLLDGTRVPKGGLSSEEKLSRVEALNQKIGKLTGEWIA